MDAAANYLRVVPKVIARCVERGELPAHNIDGRPMFLWSELDALIDRSTTKAVVPETRPAPSLAELGPIESLLLKYTPRKYPPAIYFLCHRGRIVYIGKSINLPLRIADHRSSKTFDHAFYLPFPTATREELAYLEAWFLQRLRPPLNSDLYLGVSAEKTEAAYTRFCKHRIDARAQAELLAPAPLPAAVPP